jgi:hypothetical protein
MTDKYYILSAATRRHAAPVTGGRYFIRSGTTDVVNMADEVVGSLVGGKFVVPAEVWPNSALSVECLGAAGMVVGGVGVGPGGAQWARRNGHFTGSPGDQFSLQVGVPDSGTGTTGGTPSSPKTCDTWFGSAAELFARGGGNSVNNIGGTGGAYHPPGSLWEWNDGSSGGDFAGHPNAGAGGSSGGPHGPGKSPSGDNTFGGGASGAANGGSDATTVSPADGADGGANRVGTPGGLGGDGHIPNGSVPAGDGADGLDGSGAGGGGGIGFIGGGGEGGAYPGGKGGDGSTDKCWGHPTIGPGSGGGGGGGDNENPFLGGDGGDGGPYGGAPGGRGWTLSGSANNGTPGKGVIVVSWGDMIGVYYNPDGT